MLEDYEPDYTVFAEDTPEMTALKSIIFNELTEVERRVIVLYAELQSQRELGRKLGISASSAQILVKGIREKIKGIMNERNIKKPCI